MAWGKSSTPYENMQIINFLTVLILKVIITQKIYTRGYPNSAGFYVRKQKLTAKRLGYFSGARND